MSSVPNSSGRSPRLSRECEARRSEDRRLFDCYRSTGDPATRETIVRRFLPLVRGLASRYRYTSEPFDDLMQAGSLGLLKAIERFDPDRQVAFSSFAVPTILGEIKRHLRDWTWSVKVPRGAQERAERLGCASASSSRLRRSPTSIEIAVALDVSREEVLDARTAALAHRTESLDCPHGAGQDGQRQIDMDQVEETGFAAAEDAATLSRLLSSLDLLEREVLRLRFEEDLSQAEIAGRVGCSQMHVSRVIRRAIARLADVEREQADRTKSASALLVHAMG